MSTTSFFISYDGPALEKHLMNVRDLAPALLAFSDIFEEANSLVNGDKARITVSVKGFRDGSFGIELTLTQSLAQFLTGIGGNDVVSSAANIATLLGFAGASVCGVLQIIRDIRGRKISRIDVDAEKTSIVINGDVIDIDTKALPLLRNERIRKGFDDAIRKPLEMEGVDTFSFSESSDKKPSESNIIRKEEAKWFASPPPQTEELGETESETVLQIVGVAFQDNNKWRFSDGNGIFFAAMNDDNFQRQIDSAAVMFGKGDIIKVRLRERKSLSEGQLKTEKTIIKVLEHRHPAVQLKLTD